ncbi:MAG TPA: inositol monophosphatase family protein [Allosphingosinicella sp.]|nr:inositol monophosphatase family protein [Allosphingosinicella sp.]
MTDKRLLDFAHRLADAARGETLHRWQAGCIVDNKGGEAEFDPVTEADREAERVMRALIEEEYPDHGVVGEEFPDRAAQGPFTWSLDPIDGTRSFTCGLPNWVTLIALLHEGRPLLGVIDAPCLDERYSAGESEGLLVRRGRKAGLKASDCAQLGSARLSTTDPYLFKGDEADAFERVRRSARTTRYGQDGYAYARLAAGTLDLVMECGLKPHDYNALIPVVRASGGVIGDWSGGEDFAAGNVIAAATRELYEEAVALMAGG